MPNIINQRLAARYHQNQVAAMQRLDRFALWIGRRHSGMLRQLTGLAAEDLPAGLAAMEAQRIWGASHQAMRTAIWDTLQAEIDYAHKTTVHAILRTVPMIWFAKLHPALAWLTTAGRRRTAEDVTPGPIEYDYAYEPIVPWKTDPQTTREQAREIIESTLFPPPTEEQARQWLMTPTNGMTWDQRFDRYSSQDQQSILSELTTGISTGENVAGLRRRLMPLVNNETYRAQRIARTEGRRVSELAQQQIIQECGDLIAAQQIIAVMDQFTRPEHAIRNGKVYHRQADGTFVADDGQFLPDLPDEINCRCMSVPILEAPEEFLNDPALRKEFVTATADAIPDPAAYSEWFARADTTARLHAVGVRRYAEMQRRLGREPEWIDFVDENGKLLKPSQIRNEGEADRQARRERVAAVMAEREQLYREVYGRGMFLPKL